MEARGFFSRKLHASARGYLLRGFADIVARVKHGNPSITGAGALQQNDARVVLDSIRRIVQMLRVSSRAAERDVGLSAAQLFVLEKLAAARKPLSVGELAEATLTHQSSVSVVVQKLETAGLAARTRAADDARRVELSLTPRARTLLRRAPQAAQDRIIDAVNSLSPARRKQLAQLLFEIAEKVGGGDGQPAAMLFEEPETAKAPRTRPPRNPRPRNPNRARSRS